MTAPARTPWPGRPLPPDGPPTAHPDRPGPEPGDERLAARLDEAVAAADAPDAVFAVSRRGRRTVRSGGTAPPPARPRDTLRYEIGSATKAFTGLLLTRLVDRGRLSGAEPAAALLGGHPSRDGCPGGGGPLITRNGGLGGRPPGLLGRGEPAGA
ncbi:serine hydrolase, partial [Streptomyces sp. NPDC054826]